MRPAGPLIESVSIDRFTLPLETTVRNGTTAISEREYALARIRSDTGVEGVACVFSRDVPLDAFARALASRMVGRSVFDIQEIWAEHYRAGELFFGRTGAYARAVSVVDIALWDLAGKVIDQPLTHMLGGERRPVPVMAAAGYYRPDGSLDLLSKEYEDLLRRGFRRFKIMGGGRSVEDDAERVRVVRGILPPDASLAIDVNGAWTTARQALRFLEKVGDDFDFIEDPFRPDNRAALTQFRRYSAVPIAIGEWESGHRRILELLNEGVVDVVRLDATAIGGITEWMKAASVCTAFDKRILPHYFPELHLSMAAATPGVEAIEIVPRATGADNFDDLVTGPDWDATAEATPSDAAGLGISWRWDVIESRIRQARSAVHDAAGTHRAPLARAHDDIGRYSESR